MIDMYSGIRIKIREVLASVLPITGIVLFLCFFIAPVASGALLAFILGAILVIVGMGLFTLGADVAMTPIGEAIGGTLIRTRRLIPIFLGSFFVGVLMTISEPDLQVLASQVSSIPNMLLIICVAVGVGLLLAVAVVRSLWKLSLRYLLLICYLLVFLLAFFVPGDFLAIAFDSGGVTTGPMTVPFIMAMGVGAAAIRSDKGAKDDSFGLVALGSVGPILAVMLLGLFYPGEAQYTSNTIPDFADSQAVWQAFAQTMPHYAWEVARALLPITVVFLLLQVAVIHLPRRQLLRIGVGLVYTYIGLTVFLTGVNTGFLPVGNYLGQVIAGQRSPWLLIPIAMVIGYFIVAAEPAVHILNKQVEDITDGEISAHSMRSALAISVAISLGLAMIRVLTGISVMWFLLPGYAFALLMIFFTPQIFTAIAFDSGGVASGPMTATFLLPFAMGACEALGGDVIRDAFGLVAMVAMTPLISIQAMGLYVRYKQACALRRRLAERMSEAELLALTADIDIVEMG